MTDPVQHNSNHNTTYRFSTSQSKQYTEKKHPILTIPYPEKRNHYHHTPHPRLFFTKDSVKEFDFAIKNHYTALSEYTFYKLLEQA